MAVIPTAAARELEKKGESVDPHQLIALLLKGMIERVGQAKQCVANNNEEDKAILLGKIRAILNGLRSSIDFNAGGAVAMNLETMYVYMIQLLGNAEKGADEHEILSEIEELAQGLYASWNAIATENEVTKQSA